MWVFEESVNGRKLTDIINNDHENVKYLPGYKLPENVVSLWIYALGPGSQRTRQLILHIQGALELYFSTVTAQETTF